MRLKRTGALALVLAGGAMIAPGAAIAAPIGPFDNNVTTPGAASASPLTLNGLLVLNKSMTTTTGSQVTVLQVAGLNLLSKNNGVNTGALAVAGTVLDALNRALCPKGTVVNGSCVALLFSNTTSTPVEHNASAATVALTLGSFHLRLLGSETSTTNFGGGTCGSTSISYIASLSGVVAVPANVLAPLQNNGIAGPGAC